MTVSLSDRAKQFIDRESIYLFDRSPPAATAFLNRINDACRNLAEFPSLGLRRDGFPLGDSYRLVVGEYIMNYDVQESGVVVTTIRHGRQLPIDLPDNEDRDI